ncbi:MAG: hypothetical protein H7237_04340 [Alkalinema sp. FL-bin-369]|nr:hypothetical protein [Leptolyngbyaceae cyanobacterium LF-bin-369]
MIPTHPINQSSAHQNHPTSPTGIPVMDNDLALSPLSQDLDSEIVRALSVKLKGGHSELHLVRDRFH